MRSPRMLFRSVLAGVAGLLFVLGTACLTAPPAPTPGAPFSPADRLVTMAVSPGAARRREETRVVGGGGDRVNLRAQPGIGGARVKALSDGTVLEPIGADLAVDGRTWRNVRDPSDGA